MTSAPATEARQGAFFAELLAWHAARAAGKPAVIHPDGDRCEPDGMPAYTLVSYGELAARVAACAAGLKEYGIGYGTRTAMLVPPGIDLLTLVLAMMHVGAVPVVADPGMGLSRMLDCIHRVGVHAFIGVPAAHVLRLARPKAFTGVKSLVTVGRRVGWGGVTLEELTARGAARPPLAPLEAKPDDLALISYTTGSTGPAKPVELTVGMMQGMSHGIEEGHFFPDIRTALVTVPLMGVFDLAAGREVVVPKMNMGKVGAADPALLTDAIQRFSGNAMFASPALLGPLAAHLAKAGAQVPSLKVISSGGAPVSVDLMGALRAVLSDEACVYSTYGATEALPIALVESRESLTVLAGGPEAGLGVCVGRPAPGMSVRTIAVSDDPISRWSAEMPLAVGEMGEIVVSGPGVSPRYYHASEADAKHKIQDGERRWHRTGDVGWIDEKDRIWFCGRKSHRVRAAGGDLQTVRCEGIFNAHPQVRRTALVGFGADGRQRPVLCVELVPGTDLREWPRIKGELHELGASNPMSKPIVDFLHHPAFPVDIRHNAKIRRELLAGWAEGQLTGSRRPTTVDWALRAVPLLGWVYLAAYPLLSASIGALTALWWADVFLSICIHAAQIPSALRAEQELATGRKPLATAGLTMLYGATWWKTRGRKRNRAWA